MEDIATIQLMTLKSFRSLLFVLPIFECLTFNKLGGTPSRTVRQFKIEMPDIRKFTFELPIVNSYIFSQSYSRQPQDPDFQH